METPEPPILRLLLQQDDGAWKLLTLDGVGIPEHQQSMLVRTIVAALERHSEISHAVARLARGAPPPAPRPLHLVPEHE